MPIYPYPYSLMKRSNLSTSWSLRWKDVLITPNYILAHEILQLVSLFKFDIPLRKCLEMPFQFAPLCADFLLHQEESLPNRWPLFGCVCHRRTSKTLPVPWSGWQPVVGVWPPGKRNASPCLANVLFLPIGSNPACLIRTPLYVCARPFVFFLLFCL